MTIELATESLELVAVDVEWTQTTTYSMCLYLPAGFDRTDKDALAAYIAHHDCRDRTEEVARGDRTVTRVGPAWPAPNDDPWYGRDDYDQYGERIA